MTDDWTTADVPRLDGDRIVVTGANSGLGFEATRVFAQRGATVIMACRSTDRAVDAADEIRADDPDGTLDVRYCDLADLESVERFAAGVADDYDDLDALCNNAGVMAIPYGETADGFERQFGINHLGHFALTGHLLPLLRESDGEARVVTQSSGLHEQGDLDPEGPPSEAGYDEWDAYADSKLANVYFGYELDRRLDAAGIEDVTSVVCHPGWAATNLQARAAGESRLKRVVMKAANTLFAQSAATGALPMLYATVEDASGGSYVGPGGLMNMRGYPEVQRSSDRSYDEEVARRLWERSVEWTGVEYDALRRRVSAED
jgi:NAD(P)-dependent dehydrogenase (short-subunit alcohol dehydrogenase family)